MQVYGSGLNDLAGGHRGGAAEQIGPVCHDKVLSDVPTTNLRRSLGVLAGSNTQGRFEGADAKAQAYMREHGADAEEVIGEPGRVEAAGAYLATGLSRRNISSRSCDRFRARCRPVRRCLSRASPDSEPELIDADGPISMVDTALRMPIVHLFRGAQNWAFMRRRRVLMLPAQNRHARTVTKTTVMPKYSDIFIDPELKCYSHSAMSENPI